MDFHTLSRRELQALCKKNKIPANMTNLAMADALAALQQVEGLEEFLNPPESDTEQLMEKDPCETPGAARTAMRTSTRRKPNKEQQEPESVLSTRSRRSTRKVPDQKAVQECVGTHLQETPAAPATRRRVHAASARRKVEMIDQEDKKDELNKNVPEDDPVMESRQKKPSVQKVYSTRRSVRLLEKTMASLTLADKTTIEPIKMNELDMETAAKEVKEVEDIKNEYEVNTEIVFAHGWEDYEAHSVQSQSQSGMPENEMEGEDAKEENAEIDNSSNVSAGVEPALQSRVPENETKVEDGKEENSEIDSSSNVSAAVEPSIQSGVPENEMEVEDEKEENAEIDHSSNVPAAAEPALSGSDVKDGDHDADPLVHNIIETALDLVDGYIVKMGDNSAIEVEEENVSFETKCQLLALYDTSAAETSESAIEVENQFGVHTSAIEDSEEHSPSEGPLACQNLGEIISEPQEGTDETIFQNVLEVPSLPEDSSQQLESGRKYASSEPPTDRIFNLDQLVPECNAATSISISAGLVSVDKMGSEVSAVDKSRVQVGQFDEKENITTDEPSLTEIPSTQIVKSISVSSVEAEKFAVTDHELILPRAKTPENIQLFAYSEASTDGFIMPHVEFAEETDGLPKSLAKTPTSAKRMDVFSPRMAGKSSSKKQNPLKKMENIMDENKENINSSIMRAEPDTEKANVDEDNMTAPLNEKSLRQLTKMLKEKLQIANKKSNDVPMQQSGKIRQALQALPDNPKAVAKTGEN